MDLRYKITATLFKCDNKSGFVGFYRENSKMKAIKYKIKTILGLKNANLRNFIEKIQK